MDRKTILEEAISITTGSRTEQYGGPEDSFSNIARFWSVYLDVTITPDQAGIMLALMKVARLKTNRTHEDSFVDLAGYAGCAGEIALKRKYEDIEENTDD